MTRASFHWRRIHSRVAMAPARAIRLLVVCGEKSKKSHRATLSPARASTSAALPPGLGFELSLPRQLSSAWTSTAVVFRSATSGLNHDRGVGMAQDLLRVRHDDGAGAARAATAPGHVRAREEGVAAQPLDHPGHGFAGPAGLDLRLER